MLVVPVLTGKSQKHLNCAVGGLTSLALFINMLIIKTRMKKVRAMPHLTIEYSANLDAAGDIAGLCRVLHAAILDSGLFELGAVRVRALRCMDYAIADLLDLNAFADLRLRIGAGRSSADMARAGEAVFAAACAHFAPLFEAPHFALTLDVAQNDPVLSWKKNAIHPRLRAK